MNTDILSPYQTIERLKDENRKLKQENNELKSYIEVLTNDNMGRTDSGQESE